MEWGCVMSYKRLAKRQAAAQHNAQYEARKNSHCVEPLFNYIASLARPAHFEIEVRQQARAALRRDRVILAASLISGGYA